MTLKLDGMVNRAEATIFGVRFEHGASSTTVRHVLPTPAYYDPNGLTI